MIGAHGFDYWWLIPLIMIGLCIFWGRGCCFGWRRHYDHRSDRNVDATSASALEILGRRYARGEIDDEEYQRKRKAINTTIKGEMK